MESISCRSPTRVLTLGTAHLSQLKAPVNEVIMAALLDRLAAFAPEIITVENVSGEQCDTLNRYAALYPESFATWCKTTESAQHAIGMGGPSAAAEI